VPPRSKPGPTPASAAEVLFKADHRFFHLSPPGRGRRVAPGEGNLNKVRTRGKAPHPKPSAEFIIGRRFAPTRWTSPHRGEVNRTRCPPLVRRFFHLAPLGRGRLRSSRVRGTFHSIGPQRTFDHFQHTLEIFIHVGIRDTDDEKTAGLKDVGSGLVSRQFRRFGVGDAINFDDQLSVDRDEIHDVSIDGMLAAKFPTRQPAIAQRLPKPRLGACL
jgi:hypothetical protein